VSAPGAKPVICVVAGALFDGGASARDRRVLIAERPAGRHMAGRWEFPGGKVAADESESAALVRELREELGVAVTGCRPFMRLSHEYDDRVVELSMWIVDVFSGEPSGLDGQALKWVAVEALGEEDILEADAPFVSALREAERKR
jgi:8-oxo-dGTP diphosphatase